MWHCAHEASETLRSIDTKALGSDKCTNGETDMKPKILMCMGDSVWKWKLVAYFHVINYKLTYSHKGNIKYRVDTKSIVQQSLVS